MIPDSGINNDVVMIQKNRGSLTYQIDFDKKRIVGLIDGIEAVKQAAYLILKTERFDFPVFSWNYGFEGKKLIGKPFELVLLESERLITEALTEDDRITDVIDFEFTREGKKLKADFMIVSIFGNFPGTKEVSY